MATLRPFSRRPIATLCFSDCLVPFGVIMVGTAVVLLEGTSVLRRRTSPPERSSLMESSPDGVEFMP